MIHQLISSSLPYGHPNPIDTLLIVDQDEIQRQAPIQPQRQAQGLKSLVNAFGRNKEMVALVSAHDAQALAAFASEGYQVIPVNGNRASVVHELAHNLCGTLDQLCPRQVVMVSQERAFQIFCKKVTNLARLSIWTPSAEAAAEWQSLAHDCRPLTDMLPEDRPAVGWAWIDFENIYFANPRYWKNCAPADLARAIRRTAGAVCQVTRITACADWRKLREHNGRDLQEALEEAGIMTMYQKSKPGANSSDMKIADLIRTALQHPGIDAPQVILLLSHDGDFRPVLETARQHNRTILVLSLNAGVSRELRSVAHQVLTLDLPALSDSDPAALPEESIRPTDAGVAFIIGLESWLRRQRCAAISHSQLEIELGKTAEQQANEALRRGILLAFPERPGELALNPRHPLVKAAREVMDWTCERLTYALRQPGMQYVDSHYLINGMKFEKAKFRAPLQITPQDVTGWLRLMAAAGWLRHVPLRHPKNPQKTIDTWLPGGARQATGVE